MTEAKKGAKFLPPSPLTPYGSIAEQLQKEQDERTGNSTHRMPEVTKRTTPLEGGDWRERLDRERRQEQEDRERQMAEAVERKQAREALEEHKQEMEHRWLQAGGTPDGFKKAWPTLENDYLTKKVQAGTP